MSIDRLTNRPIDMPINIIEEKVYLNKRITPEEAIELFYSNDIFRLGRMASYATEKKNKKNVYFIHNRHINPTNICVNRCKFCAFSKDKGENGAYQLTLGEILEKARSAEKGVSEFHIVGGLHPDLPFEFYLEMLRALKKEFSHIHIQAFTAVEIDYFSRISALPHKETLLRLKEAGLGSLPGGGAEIFQANVRNAICEEKISGERWLEVMEAAHSIGLKSNATMLYGHIEGYEDRVAHMSSLRELQDRTGGFQAFIPLPFHPHNTRIKRRLKETTGMDDLKTLAISRIFLDNFDHIKTFWIMLGEKMAQVSLSFGVDDIDGTVVEEKITHAAGAKTSEELTKEEIINLIQKAGKVPVERDTLYNIIRMYEHEHSTV